MKFQPSKAHRWVGGGCTGSVHVEPEAYRVPPGDSAQEGIRLHELAAEALTRRDHDTVAPEDWEQIWPYVRDVGDARLKFGGESFVEEKVTHPDFGTGYIDHRLRTQSESSILWDYKSGYRTVEAKENWQLLCYSLMLGLSRVELRIVQPNGYHPEGPVRAWRPDSLSRYHDRIRAAHTEAKESPKFVATPSNCTHCAAVTTCAAARKTTLGGVDMAMTDTGHLAPDAFRTELVTLRTAKELIGTRLDALEAEAEARLRKGEKLDGCGMRAARAGALKWNADQAQVSATLEAMGVEPVKTKPITPRQAMDAGVPESVVKSMAKRTAGKMTVSTETQAEMEEMFKDD